MLKGQIKNCYGLEDFKLIDIPFDTSGNNNAMIYAPNGIMKTSLAKVFQNISEKKESRDQIFDIKGEYEIDYWTTKYTHDNARRPGRDRINEFVYVINSFDEKFKSQDDSISSIIADDKLKKAYDLLLKDYSSEISSLEETLFSLSEVDKGLILRTILNDFNIEQDTQWFSLLRFLQEKLSIMQEDSSILNIKYNTLFNPKTEMLYSDPSFSNNIRDYLDSFNEVLKKSKILKQNFDISNFEDFKKSVEKNNLFNAGHKLELADGTKVTCFSELEEIYSVEIAKIQSDPSVKDAFTQIEKVLNKNQELKALKELLKSNPLLIHHFDNIIDLKKNLWLNYIKKEFDTYNKILEKLNLNEKSIKKIIEEANNQTEEWANVINIFKERFQVPFDIRLENKASVMLEGKLPILTFIYTKSNKTITKTKEELMSYMSTGEKRAFYLLQVLFDINKISKMSKNDGKRRLLIIDDIADSFDYKNKYAIIEYLKEISNNKTLDLLILTHNFDFYRSIFSRLNLSRDLCFIVQKNNAGLVMQKMPYNQDYFKNGLFNNIQNGNIDNEIKEKQLIASIPFFRNLSQYINKTSIESDLTNYLHIKSNTNQLLITDYLNLLSNESFILSNYNYHLQSSNPKYIDRLFTIAETIILNPGDAINLDDKILLSIALRLKAELYMQKQLSTLPNISLMTTRNQTREWFDLYKASFPNSTNIKILETVNIITPENIHINAFMYEPLIDVSMNRLVETYKKLSIIV